MSGLVHDAAERPSGSRPGKLEPLLSDSPEQLGFCASHESCSSASREPLGHFNASKHIQDAHTDWKIHTEGSQNNPDGDQRSWRTHTSWFQNCKPAVIQAKAGRVDSGVQKRPLPSKVSCASDKGAKASPQGKDVPFDRWCRDTSKRADSDAYLLRLQK